MAKYRIVERDSMVYLGERVYDVEEKVLFWWVLLRKTFLDQESAEQYVEHMVAWDNASPTRDPVVVKVYD